MNHFSDMNNIQKFLDVFPILTIHSYPTCDLANSEGYVLLLNWHQPNLQLTPISIFSQSILIRKFLYVYSILEESMTGQFYFEYVALIK